MKSEKKELPLLLNEKIIFGEMISRQNIEQK